MIREMKKRIIVKYGEATHIARLLNCSLVMVSDSLAYRRNSRLARSIRKLAIERGGVQAGDNNKTDEHEK